jgi:hypothetical protein
MSEDQIKALLHELERHLLAGREERIAHIKQELKALGHRAGSVSNGPSDTVEKAVQPK